MKYQVSTFVWVVSQKSQKKKNKQKLTVIKEQCFGIHRC